MKLTTLLIIVSILQVSATTFAQKITLSKKNAALTEVFTEIQQQTGYDFVFNASTLKDAQKVTIQVKNTELSEVLDRIFDDQPLKFTIENKMVVVSKKEPGFLDKLIDRFQSIDVRGRVVDESGSPLPGATVKGSGKVVTTNANGEFYLNGITDDAVLVISYIGYAEKVVNAKSDLLNIVLQLDNSKLKEVQIIAYGQVSRKFSTSNIGTIKARDIQNTPVSNVQLALAGRVPGLLVKQGSGVSASSVELTVQGKNSIRSGNEPFYVIDGVPYMATFTGTSLMGGAIAGNGGSALSFINPADIESISVLKDADATAIYGSRAANGAILITTRKGKAGKTTVDVNLQNSWSEVTKRYDLLTTEEYIGLRKEFYTNNNQAIPTPQSTPSTSNYDLSVWDPNKYTDWQKKLVGGTALLTNLQASISGGSVNTQFLASYGYIRESTVYLNSPANDKGNVHFNLNHTSNNQKFRYQFNGSFLQGKNRLYNQDLMTVAYRTAPNAPDMYNADGSINWAPAPKNPNLSTYTGNPAVLMAVPYEGTTSNLLANNTIGYEIIHGLQLKSSMGINRLSGYETKLNPITIQKPELPTRDRTALYLNKSVNSWIIEPQITYNRDTKLGAFDFLIGGSIQQAKTKALQQTGSSYVSDSQLDNIAAAANIVTNFNQEQLYKYNALFGRFNYRVNDKYVINLTARRDGSSRFGSENKLHSFYSVGGAWLFGSENFIKDRLSWFSFGKLKANYGTTGNDQIGDYRYLSLFENMGTEIPYQGTNGILPTNIVNPYLQWEETHKLNLGVELGFIEDRIFLTANYFRNRSSNQLLIKDLPFITGFGSTDLNLPAVVQNSGFELQLDGTFFTGNKFSWRSSANLTIPRNKIVSFPDLENSPYRDSYIIGESFTITKAYHFLGVNTETGLYEFLGADGKGTSSPNVLTDRTEIIDMTPKFYGGFVNTFQYAGFTLDVLFQFVKQNGIADRFGNGLGSVNANQQRYVLDHWRKPGDVSYIQKVSSSAAANTASRAATNSDGRFADASYMRLKNVSLSYNLPGSWISRVHISNARLYMQAQNLWTITNYVGIDPETQRAGSIPPLRTISAGVQLTF